jgi:hypothetical protein
MIILGWRHGLSDRAPAWKNETLSSNPSTHLPKKWPSLLFFKNDMSMMNY